MNSYRVQALVLRSAPGLRNDRGSEAHGLVELAPEGLAGAVKARRRQGGTRTEGTGLRK